jgi:hypothetical protein
MFERFFVDDDGTLIDRTVEWSNPYSKPASWDCKSYLYISSFLPFNHKYIDIATANDQAGTLSIDIWYNSEWTSVADIVDETLSSGKSLVNSGNIYFYPDSVKGWSLEEDASDITEINKKIYNVFWMRLGFDASLDSACIINHIGHKFCDDNALFSMFPLFNNDSLKTRFKTGKTNWVEQEVTASQIIVNDLAMRGIIASKDQVVDVKRFELACVFKTAELIFSSLGQSYVEERNEARKSYSELMSRGSFNVDLSKDGKQDRLEKYADYTMLGR